MLIKYVSALALGVLAFGITSQASNLINNGSFESGRFVPDANGCMSLPPGSGAIDGWIISGGWVAWVGPNNPFGLTASDGNYFLDLSGYQDGVPYGGIVASQTLATQVGARYLVSLDLGASTLYDSSPPMLNLYVGNESIFLGYSPTMANQWKRFSFEFTATSDSTGLSIAGTGLDKLKYIGLDNFSVTSLSPVPVPEPTTLALAGMAATAAAVMLRRRK